MCGIAGIVYLDRQRPVDPGLLKAMGDRIAHRGPDAEGFFVDRMPPSPSELWALRERHARKEEG